MFRRGIIRIGIPIDFIEKLLKDHAAKEYQVESTK